MSASTSRYQDTAAMDFINLVQAETVKAALVGTPQEGVPVLSIAAPFNKDAAIPAGEVTVRDVAGLYIFDNTLLGIQLPARRSRTTSRRRRPTSSRSPAPGRSRRPPSPTP